MYIMSRSSTSSSKNSRRRSRRKPVIFGLPKPKDVIVVEIVRTQSQKEVGGGGAEAPAGDAPAGPDPAEG